jgi:hypothetical protein
MQGLNNNSKLNLSRNLKNTIIFTYSGNLDSSFGILETLLAFEILKEKYSISNFEFWITGSGQLSNKIKKLNYSFLRFYGKVSNDKLYKIYNKTTFFLNLRNPNSEKSKYSFPSKILEYFSFKRPVISFQLPSFPKEYNSLYIPIKIFSITSILDTLLYSLGLDSVTYNSYVRKAFEFVSEFKTPQYWSNSILNFITKI